MRRIGYPRGSRILHEGQILRVKLNLRSNIRGPRWPVGPAVIRWGGPSHAGIRNHSSSPAPGDRAVAPHPLVVMAR